MLACAPSTESAAPARDPADPLPSNETKKEAVAPASADTPAEEAPSPPEPAVETLPESHSTSIGTPTEGTLTGGVPLPLRGPGLLFNPAKDPNARHGTVELVAALVRAAAVVDVRLPGGTLEVGDLSMPQGGDIPGHVSHRSGRDVDVLFYFLDETGAPADAKAIPVEPSGWGTDYGDLSTADDDRRFQLDVPRTWAFLEALAQDEGSHVNRVFVVEHLRELLLSHARETKAPALAIERVAAWTCQPNFPHDDHMHIRVYCTPQDIAAGCEDTPPFYPWHLEHLEAHDTKPVTAGKRKTKRPKLTSTEDATTRAKEKYGAFDPEVTAFLERRKAWARQPHPGRPYCR